MNYDDIHINDGYSYLQFITSKRKELEIIYKEEKRISIIRRPYAIASGILFLLAAIVTYFLWHKIGFYSLIIFIPFAVVFWRYLSIQRSDEVKELIRQLNREMSDYILDREAIPAESVKNDIDWKKVAGYFCYVPKVDSVSFSPSDKFSKNLDQYGRYENVLIQIDGGVDDKGEKKLSKSFESLHSIQYPFNIRIPSQAVFLSKTKTKLLDDINLLDGLNKRKYELTDTELAEIYNVNIGSLVDALIENEDNAMYWTSKIDAFFETVLKALTARLGQINLFFDENALFVWTRDYSLQFKHSDYNYKEIYSSVFTSRVKGLEHANIFSSYREATTYFERIYTNKILYYFVIYFLGGPEIPPELRAFARRNLENYIANTGTFDFTAGNELFKEFRDSITYKGEFTDEELGKGEK